VLRRARPSTGDEMLGFSDLAMDLSGHRVTRNGRNIHLGPTEFRLLRFFLEHPGRVFSRAQLLDAVWGRDVYVEPARFIHDLDRPDPHRALRRIRPRPPGRVAATPP
jgi:DNA-binding response OmpR family regulator